MTPLVLPQGIADISTEDHGCGPLLQIKLANGRMVLIDCQCLDGEHEVQVGVYDVDQHQDMEHVGGMNFNATGPVKGY